MIVVDAGVVIGWFLGDVDTGVAGDDDLAAPHLIDRDIQSVLRRLTRLGTVSESQAQTALTSFGKLEISRYAADWLRPRMWELRHNLTAYDATYVALAELAGATEMLTTDARLARAPGIRCVVRLV